MKGMWRTNLSGYDRKGSRRKKVSKRKLLKDSVLHFVKNNKIVENGGKLFLGGSQILKVEAYGRLDDFNKSRKKYIKQVNKKVRARTREFISHGDWNQEIKDVYGVKSVDYLVS